MSKQYFQTIHSIITTGHWVTDQIGKELKEFGISEPQYNVLRVLKEAQGEPVTVARILENMVQRSSNVTRIVDKLLSKGYVTRKENPDNRRKMDICITVQGMVLLEKLDQKVYEFHAPMMERLTPEELNSLKTLILKLNPESND